MDFVEMLKEANIEPINGKYVTITMLCKALHVSRPTAYKYEERGLKSTNVSKKKRLYKISDVNNFIKKINK